MLDTKTLYQLLYEHMGPQGWWPAESKIEVMLGAILVQNTNWRNAAYAIESLKQATHLEPHHILNLKVEELQILIKSSGFYKNKAQTILSLLTWLEHYDFDYQEINDHYKQDLRQALIAIKGIGSETADVLIVYIFGGVEFIADSYSRRLYRKLGYTQTNSYEQLKRHINLPNDFSNQDANEFHALLDNFGKNYFNGKINTKYTFLDAYFEK
ncbi:endonuclease III [Staphylococcus equorum]|uniref:endonuclease III domain-containing protein n=1 Tax=Staphylococcus equorum TaxID=246432 RepID=UPI000D1D036A|nr:endonuclease III [Staphylococcus equorum]PTE44003.1 endonuclease III [Staphylococcus equorum]PTE85427.1 endonuclease III [Staphylococcus equorum]PTF12141.1 endonuclease III [Staphylococcus equorum]RIL49870.1 endonuclease III domain-containing protein [Staphylococcus equorum]